MASDNESYWKTLFDQRNWSDIDNWWQFQATPDERRELLDRLNAEIPKKCCENALDRWQEPIHPDDAPEEWKGAAKSGAEQSAQDIGARRQERFRTALGDEQKRKQVAAGT